MFCLSFKLSALLAVIALVSADLHSDLSGRNFTVAFPGDPQYATLSQAFNRRYNFKPAAIARPSTPQDVSVVLRASAANHYQVVARGGGHSYIANGLGGKDDSVVIDMHNFNSITVDSLSGNAVIGSGNRLGDVVLALNSHGRAMPHGICPYVGIGGHSGYGGWGFTARMWGLTLDNILSIDVVLANGTTRTASSSSYSDLFWALRGAAGSFAVTTAITFKTYPVPTSASLLGYNWDLNATEAAAGLETFQRFAHANNIPARLGPRLAFTKGSAQGRVRFRLEGGWYGDDTGLNAVLKPFLDAIPQAPLPGSGYNTVPYIESARILAGDLPLNTSTKPQNHDTFYVKSLTTPEGAPINDAASRVFMNYLANEGFNANTDWFVEAGLYGGSNSAINSVSPDATAYAHRNTLLTFQFYSRTFNNEPPFPTAGFSFLDGMVNSLVNNAPLDWDYGAYLNYVEDRLQNWKKLYFGAHYARLHDIKTKYDPQGLFVFPTGVQAGVSVHPNGNPNKCLDVRASTYANGTAVQIFDCNDTGAQNWIVNRGGKSIRVSGTNFCLDAGPVPGSGVKTTIHTCSSNLPQQTWTYNPNNTIALSVQDQCLDLTNGVMTNGNQIQTLQCLRLNPDNQLWTTQI